MLWIWIDFIFESKEGKEENTIRIFGSRDVFLTH